MRRACAAATAFLLTVGAQPALADATVFIGSQRASEGGSLRGAALGISLVVLGLEFEYAETRPARAADGLVRRSGMLNLLLQTPRRAARVQFYAAVGGGLYREGDAATGFARNAGGGIRIPLLGPLDLRVDYRVFHRGWSSRGDLPQRIYAGVNLAF